MLADDDLTPKGVRNLVRNMEVLKELGPIRLTVKAKVSAQRLATGIQTHFVAAGAGNSEHGRSADPQESGEGREQSSSDPDFFPHPTPAARPPIWRQRMKQPR